MTITRQQNGRHVVTRRHFQTRIAAGGIGLLSASAVSPLGISAVEPRAARGKAEACIVLWLGGGMCHLDTFDPKRLGEPKSQKPGSAYDSIPTAIPGARVCQHLKRTARILDRGVVVRSLNHPLKVDHADSTNLMKTGRLTSGTIVYPSLGSVISHQRGPSDRDVPPYVVMGMPNITRGPGFLGSRFGYVYLTDTSAGPTGLKRPADVDQHRQRHRRRLLELLRDRARDRASEEPTTANYDAVIGAAQRMVDGPFHRVFDLTRESPATRTRYGGEFGQRCLLARRLVTGGARFVEVAYDLNFKNGTGWDTHRHGQARQHLLIQDLDQALSALLHDLEARRLLDSTLVVVATEFGRPAEFDAQGGRGHQSAAFSVAMFGGGIRSAQVIGETDELGSRVVSRSVTVPDFHATILAVMGIDPATLLYDGDRPIPITDHGTALSELF